MPLIPVREVTYARIGRSVHVSRPTASLPSQASDAVSGGLAGDAARMLEHPDYDLAAPTPDHLIPALYFAGIAAADGGRPQRPHRRLRRRFNLHDRLRAGPPLPDLDDGKQRRRVAT